MVITRPNVQYTPQNQQHHSIDLSKHSPIQVATFSSAAATLPTTHIVKTSIASSHHPTTISNNIPNHIHLNSNNITIFNHIDESNTSLNLTSDTSGYLSNSTDTSLMNASFSHKIIVPSAVEENLEKGGAQAILQPQTEQQLQQEVQRIQQQAAFNPLPLPNSTITGSRRRTISSNSNRWVREILLKLNFCSNNFIPSQWDP